MPLKLSIHFLAEKINTCLFFIKKWKKVLTYKMFCSNIHIVDDESDTGVSGSVGRVQPCQGWGRGFESRLTLRKKPKALFKR